MNFFNDRKLSLKLSVTIGLVLILAMGSLLLVNLKQIYNTSLQHGEFKAREESSELAIDYQRQINVTNATLKTLRNILLDASLTDSLTREDVVRLLSRQLEGHPDILAFSTLWEPNAFDNNDIANQNKQPYDNDTGRFIPYVVRAGDKIIVEPLVDYEQEGAGDYYLIPKTTKKTLWTEPYLYPVNGKDVLMTSIIMPIVNEQGVFLGMVGVDMALVDIQKQIEQLKPLGGYATMISSKGTYVANGLSPDKVSMSYAENESRQALWADVKKGRMSSYTDGGNGQNLHLFHPIRIEGSDDVWYMETVVSRQTILEDFSSNWKLSLVITVAALVLISAVILLVLRLFVLRPINEVNQLSAILADGIFTKKLTVRNKDEFGVMSEQFNTMVDKLRDMIHTVKENAISVGTISAQLSASAEEVNNSSLTKVNAFQTLTEMYKDLTEAIQSVSRSAKHAADLSEQSKQDSNHGGEVVQTSIDSMQQLKAKITDLEQDSDKIGEILEVIDEIADQTNLLALNAAIEAARAGDQGKGFAVVADEVRKLAERSSEATKQISLIIKGIQDNTLQCADAVNQTAELSVKTEEAFRHIREKVEEVSKKIMEIASAGTEQSVQTVEVLKTIESLSLASEEAATAAEEMARSSQSQSHLAEQLIRTVSIFKIDQDSKS